MAQRPAKKNGKADAETFVREWQRAGSVKEVSAKMGIRAQSASVRALRFRKMGVPLKKMPGRAERLDFAALAKLARSIKP